MKKYTVGLIGATGLVGRTILDILDKENLPIEKLILFASKNSENKKLKYKNKYLKVNVLDEKSLENLDICLFAVNKDISAQYVPIALKNGCVVIDNSSFFRMKKNVPLIVPEINFETITDSKLISNPNCATIQSVMVLNALKKYGIKKINYVSLQSVSGAGKKALMDLKNKTQEFFPHPINQNIIPLIGNKDKENYSAEEVKMIEETKKILNLKKVCISSTCLRIPIEISHSVVIKVKLMKKVTCARIKKDLACIQGIKVLDDLDNNIYPLNLMAKGNDLVYVGRIRKDLSEKNSFLLYCVSDNLRKGAALNVVQILKRIILK